VFVPRYDEQEAREAVRTSLSYTEALRKVGLRPAGGNHALFRRYVDEIWRIPTNHFDPHRGDGQAAKRSLTPLDEVLVEGSEYNRRQLKRRLYDVGLKQRRCELCGQGELWRGRYMSLILDHINGIATDNRIENLRIVCANCNATLDTHCVRNNRHDLAQRACQFCGVEFLPRFPAQRYCSRSCGTRHPGSTRSHPEQRKVPRPPYDQLVADLAETNYSAVGRKYGVSDNAVRKWVRWYEAERDRREQVGGSGDVGSGEGVRSHRISP
jgi:hypothetical protein